MKIKRISKASVIEWLKRIFTLQTLAVVAAIIAAFFAYKSYLDAHPAQISIEYQTSNWFDGFKTKNVDNIIYFHNLIFPDENKVYLGVQNYSFVLRKGWPYFWNKSGKAIEDFHLEVEISHGELVLDEKSINPSFEILSRDTVSHKIRFLYKYDMLTRYTWIHNPIEYLSLPDSSVLLEDSLIRCDITYSVTYKGIKKRGYFFVENTVFLNDSKSMVSRNEQIDSFLTNCYQNHYFTALKKISLFTIMDNWEYKIVSPPRRLTDDKFKEFKKKYIEDFN